ncbi:MAG: hypothetical protein KGZ60_00110 [Truepera sp.]|nr:hypothetical protein [Truepera sp.]
MNEFLSADFLKFFIPLAGGVVAWIINEYRKRQAEEYARKEERYRGLILSLRGFYVGSEDLALKQEFVNQLSLCWLYCSDNVIAKANKFVVTLKPESTASAAEKEQALSALIGAIRSDLLSRKVVPKTKLTGAEFERLSIVPPNISVNADARERASVQGLQESTTPCSSEHLATRGRRLP